MTTEPTSAERQSGSPDATEAGTLPPPPRPRGELVPTMYDWAGGLPALNRLTRRFYDHYVDADPLLAPLFSQRTEDHPEKVAAWLAEVFGGPKVHSENYGGFRSMMLSHLRKHFSEPQRARFVELLCKSADDVGLPADAEFRAAFVAYLEWGSRIAKETSHPAARPPQRMQMPIWGWIRDAVPGSRPSSFQGHEEPAVALIPVLERLEIDPDKPPSFARHIQPLFREMDRRAMAYAFDLWDADSVRAHAERIMGRLENGTMPVDGPWPPEALELLRRWIDTGMND
jgi:truncated hemoglobin YjbI